ncbi:glycosyl transferase [Ketogulonicigenium vulgare]|uniref:Putative glycosyltransferase n=1 Tax=Ketogulonicigenium vulgare (strain WSH-001) TaxID=759362 RepID=F9Y877_KETVW|nr:glycosyl transferase [Ketogulonicigenium vulgare]ADO41513.1 rb106 [Ketogulonicigenium vulgare Y25]AEM42363.1 putative glycosyltransferase [Ketogulonicigenium vulgare WSH-001]ALJ79986.1 glycosyl transferase [Ketogulonicigenium vulgare]AOZ53447.1 hypothetical protein KVC_0421 [Ketogulonicigenium vulgare]
MEQSFILQHFTLSPGLYLPGQQIVLRDPWGDLINAAKWRQVGAGPLSVRISGEGQFLLQAYALIGAEAVLLSSLRVEGGQAVVLDALRDHVVRLSIIALSCVHLRGAVLLGAQPQRRARLAICIPAFGAGRGLPEKLAVLRDYLRLMPLGAEARVLVIDQGLATPPVPHAGLRVVAQHNLGGAGGFARALREAQCDPWGFTHCLFTDDDAHFTPEALHRLHAYLSLAQDPQLAVAAAMVTHQQPDQLWESGAIFDGFCRGAFRGTDLMDQVALARIERTSAQADWQQQPGIYGGWWMFGFALAGVRYAPFPYFLRGDDIGFALANRLRIVTLNGVCAAQDDFAAKEGPLSLFCDLRGHLIHPMVFPQIPGGRWRVGWRGALFVLRSLARFRYDEAAALLIAWQDVLAGPRAFATHPGAEAQRHAIAQLPRPCAPLPRKQARRAWPRWYWMLSVNGQLLPFGSRGVVHIAPRRRRDMDAIWGRRAIVTDQCDARDLRRFYPLFIRLLALWLRYMLGFKALARAYRATYGTVASQQAWDAHFQSSQPR